jgi:asparagine N-glycosylation enzyme membrane subunit Stt3
MISGLGVMLSKLLNWDDIYTVRLVFFTAGCLAVVVVYLLGKSVFKSQTVGFLAALTFWVLPYGYSAASGPRPKTLWSSSKLYASCLRSKRWFWAGLCGSLAFLIWQPMAVFAILVFLLSVARPKEERYGAARAVAGYQRRSWPPSLTSTTTAL